MNKLNLGLLSLVAVAACGGTVVSNGAGGAGGAGTTGTTTTSTSTTTTSTTGTGAGGATSGSCPATEPTTAGASCAGVPDQLRCTYGDSVRPDCRDAWVCSGGLWTTNHSVCVEPPAGVCGAAQPPAETVCPGMGDVCTYGDDICYCGCSGGLCAVPYLWQCSGSPTVAGCPPVVPNDGTACSVEGADCVYGAVCSSAGAEVSCTDGRWLWNLEVVCAG